MNKNELIDAIAARTGESKAATRRIINEMVDVITDELRDGARVLISDFGVFDIQVRRAHRGTHPRTQEKIDVGERRIAKFRPGKKLRKLLNKERRLPGI